MLGEDGVTVTTGVALDGLVTLTEAVPGAAV
jgi:hypothetical protein